ncbi:MAG: hypothetical protein LBV08_02490 [Clostridiales bacterium]|jgi:hypothetical protein|nr:hypothetical protein [Clostridiales bacterium]
MLIAGYFNVFTYFAVLSMARLGVLQAVKAYTKQICSTIRGQFIINQISDLEKVVQVILNYLEQCEKKNNLTEGGQNN